MSKTLQTLILVAALFGLLALSACTREITTVQQVDPGASNCFSCHSDQETWLISIERQWSESRHGEGEVAFEGTRASCAACHSSDGFLAQLAGEEVVGYENPAPIHCFTCHAPHSDANFNLRVTTAQTLLNGTSIDVGNSNTCVACHHSRQNVTTYVIDGVRPNTRFGPHHGPQGDMLFGSNMYEYAEYTYEEFPYHRNAENGACVACHMASSGYFTVGGHSFAMEGDVEGAPEINTNGCNNAACHAGGVEDYNYGSIQDSVATLVTDLEVLLLDAGYITDALVPVTQALTADQAGALFNYVAVKEDRSLGVHNPPYIIGLLQSSIAFMESQTPTN